MLVPNFCKFGTQGLSEGLGVYTTGNISKACVLCNSSFIIQFLEKKTMKHLKEINDVSIYGK